MQGWDEVRTDAMQFRCGARLPRIAYTGRRIERLSQLVICRAELSPSDRAKQTARRKAIYLELHPETAHRGNLQGAGVANLASPETPAFSAATAKVTGQSERSVQRDAERGEKVIDEVIDLIKGTGHASSRKFPLIRCNQATGC
jgi:hypothetical protein